MSFRKLWENDKVESKRKEIEKDGKGAIKYVYPVVGILMVITFIVVAILGAV